MNCENAAFCCGPAPGSVEAGAAAVLAAAGELGLEPVKFRVYYGAQLGSLSHIDEKDM